MSAGEVLRDGSTWQKFCRGRRGFRLAHFTVVCFVICPFCRSVSLKVDCFNTVLPAFIFICKLFAVMRANFLSFSFEYYNITERDGVCYKVNSTSSLTFTQSLSGSEQSDVKWDTSRYHSNYRTNRINGRKTFCIYLAWWLWEHKIFENIFFVDPYRIRRRTYAFFKFSLEYCSKCYLPEPEYVKSVFVTLPWNLLLGLPRHNGKWTEFWITCCNDRELN